MCKTFFVALALVFALGGIASADDKADARNILNEGIKARGGDATLGKFVGIYCKFKGTSWEKPLSAEWFIQGNDKIRKVSFDENGKITWVEVVNGKEGWKKHGDRDTEKIDKDQLSFYLDDIFEAWTTMLAPPLAKDFRMSRLDENSVTGRMAVGVFHNDRVELHFDQESHQLVKYVRHIRNDIGEEIGTEEHLYSDYRNVQGTKQSFKIEAFSDGVKREDLAVSEIKLYEKPLDEKLFSKP